MGFFKKNWGTFSTSVSFSPTYMIWPPQRKVKVHCSITISVIFSIQTWIWVRLAQGCLNKRRWLTAALDGSKTALVWMIWMEERSLSMVTFVLRGQRRRRRHVLLQRGRGNQRQVQHLRLHHYRLKKENRVPQWQSGMWHMWHRSWITIIDHHMAASTLYVVSVTVCRSSLCLLKSLDRLYSPTLAVNPTPMHAWTVTYFPWPSQTHTLRHQS